MLGRLRQVRRRGEEIRAETIYERTRENQEDATGEMSVVGKGSLCSGGWKRRIMFGPSGGISAFSSSQMDEDEQVKLLLALSLSYSSILSKFLAASLFVQRNRWFQTIAFRLRVG